MRAHWISLVLLVCCTSAHARVSRAQAAGDVRPVAQPDFSAARQLIHQWMARDSVPGLAIAVARRDSILWEEGFGWADRDSHVPATAHTPFYLASVTKTITATALMLLHQQGRLDLDRPANEYLGGASLWSPAWDPAGATPRRLASHTSGLTTFDLGCAVQQPHCRIPSADELIRRYGVLVSPPGLRFDYSNLGYLVLGEVVARVTGRDLGGFLRQELFQPLGMTRSSLGVDSALEAQTAVQYHWVHAPIRRPTGPVSGASSAYASAHDLLRFGQLHAKVSRPGVPKVLSDAAIDTMQYWVVPARTDSRYGLGWWVEEDRFGYRSLLAQGGTPASSAWLRLVPSEGIAVVVLANKGVGFPGDVADEVLAAMLPRYAALRAAQQAKQPSAGPARASPVLPALDSAFLGAWSGIVRVETVDLPIAVTVADSGSVSGTLRSRPDHISGRAQICCGGSLFRINLPGDFTTPDSSEGRLIFYLRLHDGLLRGHVTTRPDPRSGLDGRVSYWVELRKQRSASR